MLPAELFVVFFFNFWDIYNRYVLFEFSLTNAVIIIIHDMIHVD